MNAYKPRSYQENCLEALASARAQGETKALVVMASGLGKTLTGAFDIREYLKVNENGRVLVLCHSAAILSQTKETFKAIFGDGYSYGMYNGMEKAAHRTDFLFANLQSINLHSDEFDPDEFCYVVVDEAHHSPAETYRKAIEHFRPQFLLGMTATPDRMDDADLAEIFGKTVFEYDLISAVGDGWLSEIDYRLELDELENLETVLDSGEPVSLSQLNREFFIPKRDEEIVRLIRERSAEKTDPTTVIFCQTIAHAEKFAELMGDAAVIHSGLDSDVIAERLEGFRSGSIKTVCAVDMLNEGIDIPRTDVIVFLRVTQSKIVFFQQLGRGLRLAEGKGKVLVLDFVATAERLDQIFDLEREFKRGGGSVKRAASERENFTLTIDTPKFRERMVDIINLIECAVNYSRVFQQFPEWEHLSSCEVFEDVVQRFIDFRTHNGRMVGKSDLGIGDIPSMYFLKMYLGEQITLAEIRERAYPDARKVWTKEKIDAALIEIVNYYGKVPGQKDLRDYAHTHKNAVPSIDTIQKFYKNYEDAYRQLGYDFVVANQPWTNERILSGMQKAYDHYGHIPSWSEYDRYRKENPNDLPCIDTICTIDGKRVGWKEAFILRIGIDSEMLTAEQAASILIDVAMNCGKKSLSLANFQKYRAAHPEKDIPGVTLIQKALGAKTWNEAKARAGLVTTPWLGH